ncbi:hypothetical protein R1sor_026271 [Riccia sorocarpa]|uniref:tRNA(adenine(34)) deaminase n=1 Tax=Riccia sorocarpa TaxID=122646 RepID=A0ABD3GAY4_9MARC
MVTTAVRPLVTCASMGDLQPWGVRSAGRQVKNHQSSSSFLGLISVLEGVRLQLFPLLEVKRSSSGREFLSSLESISGDYVPNVLEHPRLGLDSISRTGLRGDKESIRGLLAKDYGVQVGTGGEEGKDAGTESSSSEQIRFEGKKKSGARSTTAEFCSPTEDETREDEKFMSQALLEAAKAASIGEVPVGAVIVQQGKIIARAHNRVEVEGDPTAHAEMLCIRQAAKVNRDWRLTDAAIYVTMEPCPMCAGALLQARVKKVVWGARNHLLGADGSWVRLFPTAEMDSNVANGAPHMQHPFHKSVQVRRELLPDECSTILRSFFRSRRKGEAPLATRKPWWLSFELWILLRRVLR